METTESNARRNRRLAIWVFAWSLVVLTVFAASVLTLGNFAVAARERANESLSRANLKDIGRGVLSFTDEHRFYPHPQWNERSAPHSWMTDLLPYIDQAELHRQIVQDQPWNAAANDSAMKTLVPTFLNPSLQDQIQHRTEFAFAHYAGNAHVLQTSEPFKPSDATDGASYTIMAGSVATGLKAWGDPTNLRDPADGIGTDPKQFLHRPQNQNVALILMLDGSVHRLNAKMDAKVWQGLVKPNDGDFTPFFDQY